MSKNKLGQLFDLAEDKQEANVLGINGGDPAVHPAAKMTLTVKEVKKRGRKKERGEFQKVTLQMSKALHSDIKTFALNNGRPIQHILQAAIKEFVAGDCNAALINDYNDKRDSLVRTSIDLDVDVYDALTDYSKSSGVKKRFIIESLLSEFLREMK